MVAECFLKMCKASLVFSEDEALLGVPLPFGAWPEISLAEKLLPVPASESDKNRACPA